MSLDCGRATPREALCQEVVPFSDGCFWDAFLNQKELWEALGLGQVLDIDLSQQCILAATGRHLAANVIHTCDVCGSGNTSSVAKEVRRLGVVEVQGRRGMRIHFLWRDSSP